MPDPKRLLIIEDDPILAELMSDYCAEIGLTPHIAPDGREGLRMAAALRPAAITVDHRLPDMTGLDVLDQLKKDPATRDIPAFYLSADAYLHESEARARGAADVLTKPVPEAVLRAALDKHIRAL